MANNRKKTTPEQTRSMTVKVPRSLDVAIQSYIKLKDTDISKLTRIALREKLKREGALI